jgi:hypothetical protein
LWSSLWLHRPDDTIEFTVADTRSGASVTYVLATTEVPPVADKATALRRRISELIGKDLRQSYGN